MDSVLRAFAVYAFLFVLMRATGKRTLADVTPFDFVLLLLIGEATQQGLLGDDFSLTNAFLVITTLVGMEIGMDVLKGRFRWLNTVGEGKPVVVVDQGVPIEERLRRSRLDESDILEAARMLHGLERMDQVKYAVLERSGSISIIPADRR